MSHNIAGMAPYVSMPRGRNHNVYFQGPGGDPSMMQRGPCYHNDNVNDKHLMNSCGMPLGSMGDFKSPVVPTPDPPPAKKKRRASNAATANIQPTPSLQDLLPPPLSGYGDTIVASNPFDDTPPQMSQPMSMPHPHHMHMSHHHMSPMGSMGGPSMGNPMGSPMNSCPPMGSPMNMGGPMGSPMGMGGPMMNSGPMGSPMGGPMGSPMNNMSNMTNMSNMSGPPHNGPMGNMNNMNNMNNMSGPPMPGSPMGGHMMSGHMGPTGGPMNMGSMSNMGAMSPMNHHQQQPIPQQQQQQQQQQQHMSSNMHHMSMHGHGFQGGPPKPMPVSAGKIYPSDQPMVFNPQNPNAPPIYPCGTCHKEVHDNDQAILCESGCNFWFHRVCTGLAEHAYQLLTAEVYAEWVCDKCLNSKNIPLVKFKP